MPAELHQNDVGTQFIFTLKDQDGEVVDISSASTLEIIFEKPGCISMTRTASLYTTGSDGKFTYTTVTGDLDEVGSYKIQGHVIIGSSEWHTDYFTEKVHRNLG